MKLYWSYLKENALLFAGIGGVDLLVFVFDKFIDKRRKVKSDRVKSLFYKTPIWKYASFWLTICIVLAAAIAPIIQITSNPVDMAQLQYLSGTKDFEAGNYEKAIEHFSRGIDLFESPSAQKREEAFELDEHIVGSLINRGISHFKLEQGAQAEQDFSQAIQLIKRNPQLKAIAHAKVNVRKAETLKTIPVPIRLANRETDGEIADSDYGLALFYLGAHAKDVAVYEKFFAAYVNRGYIYLSAKQYEAAIDDFNEAMTVDPNRGGLYIFRAHCNFEREFDEDEISVAAMKEAIFNDCEQAIKLEPMNDTFYYWRYRLTFLMRDKTKEESQRAILDLHKASELAPNNAMYYATLGSCYSPNLFIDCERDEAKAYKAYTKAIQAEPANARWYIERAEGYIDWAIRFDETRLFFTDENSMKDFNKAIDLDSNNAKAFAGRAALNSKQARELNNDEAAQAKQFYEKAAADYTRAIKMEPDNSEFFQERAKIYSSLADLLPYDNKDGQRPYYDKTIADITKAIEFEQKEYLLSSLYSRRAMYYNLIKEYDNEIADRSKAIAFEPTNPSRYTDRARVYEELKKYDKAIEDYSKAIALDDTRAYYFSSRADAYLKQEMPEEAIADFTSAILLEPDSTRYLEARAKVYIETEQFEKAIADYTTAIELEANDPPDDQLFSSFKSLPYLDRAKAYEAWGKYENAVADYTKAIELDNSTLTYSSRAMAYRAWGKYDKAVEDYTRILEEYPDDALYYFGRAKTYAAWGKNDKAVEDYNSVIASCAETLKNGESLYSTDYLVWGHTYYNLKEYEKAIDKYTKAIELSPDYSSAYSSRADAYEAIGKTDLAEADRKSAEKLG